MISTQGAQLPHLVWFISLTPHLNWTLAAAPLDRRALLVLDGGDGAGALRGGVSHVTLSLPASPPASHCSSAGTALPIHQGSIAAHSCMAQHAAQVSGQSSAMGGHARLMGNQRSHQHEYADGSNQGHARARYAQEILLQYCKAGWG